MEKTIQLRNGIRMPRLGLGVYKAPETETKQAVLDAIEAGYRLIDTAWLYENERQVGDAVRECGVPREEIFVTTKLWNDFHGYDAALAAFERSMDNLGLDYVDLYLIHWPGRNRYVETYRALEKLLRDGRVRAIGVSNFLEHHLETLMQQTETPPAVNQIEINPFYQQAGTRSWCQQRGIVVEGWRPIAKGAVNHCDEIIKIADKYDKSPVQVAIRWALQHDTVVIPKSIQKDRIVSNADVWDFTLTEGEMATIDGLEGSPLYTSSNHPDKLLF